MEIDGRRHGSIYVCKENGQHVGFIYATHNRAGVTHIQQVVIQEDARRMERATALVQAVQRDKDWLMSLRVAADLDATHFWEALGFELESHQHPKSVYGRGKNKATLPTRQRRDILRFQKVVGGLWLPKGGLEDEEEMWRAIMNKMPLREIVRIIPNGPGSIEAVLACGHSILEAASYRFGKRTRCSRCALLARETERRES